MSTLTTISLLTAYNDLPGNSNPTRKPIDWQRTIANIPCENPTTIPYIIPPLGSMNLINGTRSTSIDGTTAFSISLSTYDPNRYRILNTGGTAPAFRTDRSVVITSVVLTITVNGNLTATVVAGSGTPFASVVSGDIVFIPGIATGDPAGPFNPLNTGFWNVLSATGTTITMARDPSTVFSGITETVTPSSNGQFDVFSSTGIQIGDTVDISSGFATPTLHAYDILAVASSWVEILSTQPLGPQTGIIPTAAGMVFYTNAKRLIFIEADQECVIRSNGDTGNTNRLTPFLSGDDDFPAEYKRVGPTWQLDVVNRASVPLNLTLISAE